MATWRMGLQEEYLRAIAEGRKKIEGRLYDEKRQGIKPGDTIIFEDKLMCVVKDVRVYSSFREMLESEGIENVLPGVKDVEEGVKIYRKFYSEEKEKKYGVVAIEVEPVGWTGGMLGD
ncbi:ASCH domain-containing protein [Thermococcus waiotapuensis]|uniref:ASCH domain-containing protein n=1 Tax=Thermococcus waiotapuensis TaxID=90909 RepID=A0AAE4T117_9EURY|nr:ASCH domain-containing protein [Thermococcus waiotapuensis]MDV3103805.1 ASCH domain-containing protein [Thermococcus waiotapuensis]